MVDLKEELEKTRQAVISFIDTHKERAEFRVFHKSLLDVLKLLEKGYNILVEGISKAEITNDLLTFFAHVEEHPIATQFLQLYPNATDDGAEVQRQESLLKKHIKSFQNKPHNLYWSGMARNIINIIDIYAAQE